jgi:hypothetical protein
MLFVLFGAGSADGAVERPSAMQITPPRLAYVDGEVLFWRPGAGDWEAAQVNMPLAAGDALATRAGKLELQIGGKSFLRAAEGSQLRLVGNEPSFVHFEVTEGSVAVDLRELRHSTTVQIDTPNSAVTLTQDGYYRLDVGESTRLIVRRGGLATIRPAGGTAAEVGTGDAVEITGTNSAQLAMLEAPAFDEWDRWNYERGEAFVSAPRSYAVSSDVYGVEELERHGRWRYANTYGRVWVPDAVPAGWAPYTNGRWAWDPLYGWSWVDYAPWGWAPYHYGRWVYTGGFWGWAPGPVLAAPIYSPALVAFFGVPGFSVGFSVGVPAVSWVALGWGEPLIPWWGPVGFIGTPCWWGWGGPRVVNNVVINNNTVINANTVNFYRNFDAPGAVVGVPKDQFTTASLDRVRLDNINTEQLKPLHGALPVAGQGATVDQGGGAPAKMNVPNLRGQQAAAEPSGGAASFSRGGEAVSGAGAADTKMDASPSFDALRGGGAAAAVRNGSTEGAPARGNTNLQRGQSVPGTAGDTKAGSAFGGLRGTDAAGSGAAKQGAAPALGSANLQRGQAPPALAGGTKPGSSFGRLRGSDSAAAAGNPTKPQGSGLGASNLRRGGSPPPVPGGVKTGSSFGRLRSGTDAAPPSSAGKQGAPSVGSSNLRRGSAPPPVSSGMKAGSSFGRARSGSAPAPQRNLSKPPVSAPRASNLQRGQSPPAVRGGTKSTTSSFGGVRGRTTRNAAVAPKASAGTSAGLQRRAAPPPVSRSAGSFSRSRSAGSAPSRVAKPSAPTGISRGMRRSAPAQPRQVERSVRAPSRTTSRSGSQPSVSSPRRFSAPSRAAAPAPSANTRSFGRSMGGSFGGSSISRGAGGGSSFGRAMGGGSGFSRSMGGGGSSFGRSMGGGGKLGR